MEPISEQEVYQKAKKILVENNWQILGGEPPDGTDEIPRIEIKDQKNLQKGSKGSKKIDLIAYKYGKLLLLELKSIFSQADINKLDEIKKNQVVGLFKALIDKSCFDKINLDRKNQLNDSDSIVKAIGISLMHNIPDDYLLIQINNNGYMIKTGKHCPISENFFRL